MKVIEVYVSGIFINMRLFTLFILLMWPQLVFGQIDHLVDAVREQDLPAMQAFLDFGIGPNIPDDSGYVPYGHFSIKNKNSLFCPSASSVQS